MDKDLIKQLSEYEKLMAALPPLRVEHNFLVEDIDRKELDVKGVEERRKQITLDIQKEREEFDLYKNEFMNYKSNQEEIIATTIVKEKKLAEKAKSEAIIAQKELVDSKKVYEAEVSEFESYKASENSKIEALRDSVTKEDIKNKATLNDIESRERKLVSLATNTNASIVESEKLIKIAVEDKKESDKVTKEIAKEMKALALVRQGLNIQEDELIKKDKAVGVREKVVVVKESELNDREVKITEKERGLNELDYTLQTKQADLAIREKQLHLAIKQTKGQEK